MEVSVPVRDSRFVLDRSPNKFCSDCLPPNKTENNWAFLWLNYDNYSDTGFDNSYTYSLLTLLFIF